MLRFSDQIRDVILFGTVFTLLVHQTPAADVLPDATCTQLEFSDGVPTSFS